MRSFRNLRQPLRRSHLNVFKRQGRFYSNEVEQVEEAPESNHSHVMTSHLTPKQTVKELDRYVVGQKEAKKAVAVALRSRWRRLHLDEEIRDEVVPKNILMVGSTGSGKTEISRRLAKLGQAPFIKVESTSFTETGFVGKSCDSIIRDLVEVAILDEKKMLRETMKEKARERAIEKVLEAMMGKDPENKNSFRKLLTEKDPSFMEQHVIITLPETKGPQVNPFGSSNDQLSQLGELTGRLEGMFYQPARKTRKQTLPVSEAIEKLEEAELDSMVEEEDVTQNAIKNAQENGIVFLDEIDKITSSKNDSNSDASAEGVQRDLLPLVEGTVISTKHGNVNTHHILFIAAGAFHKSEPSDLLPELQGRLSIRVNLEALSEDDLYRILVEPEFNLLRQQTELLKTEGVELKFTDEAVRAIAKVSYELNSTVENFGARRLFPVIERIIEDYSFDAPDLKGETVEISEEIVNDKMKALLKKKDLSKWII